MLVIVKVTLLHILLNILDDQRRVDLKGLVYFFGVP